MKFVDVKNDVAFRKIFGNEKKTISIISFLNAALQLEGDQRIKEVTIISPMQVPRIVGEKASIIDVRAKDEKGRQFVVEMQVADVDGFDKRVQYYTCRDYSMQIKKGTDYPLLKPTHFVGILDFNIFESPHYLAHHIIVNGETYEHKLKDIQFTFIELKKFNVKLSELKTLLEKWVYFIKNAEDLEVIPEHVNDEGLKEAYKDADLHNWNTEEWIDYDNASIAEQDAIGKITIAEKKGEKKGERKKEKSVIKQCLKENMSIEMMSRIVNLAIDEVEEIIEMIKNEKNYIIV